jgi:hypothetical protein
MEMKLTSLSAAVQNLGFTQTVLQRLALVAAITAGVLTVLYPAPAFYEWSDPSVALERIDFGERNAARARTAPAKARSFADEAFDIIKEQSASDTAPNKTKSKVKRSPDRSDTLSMDEALAIFRGPEPPSITTAGLGGATTSAGASGSWNRIDRTPTQGRWSARRLIFEYGQYGVVRVDFRRMLVDVGLILLMGSGFVWAVRPSRQMMRGGAEARTD